MPHRALILAPFRGPGLELLSRLADVTLDPWIDHHPAKFHSEDELQLRLKEAEADILIVEADAVSAAVLEHPLVAVGSTRGDPNNIDVAAATSKGIPVLFAPGRNADAVAELTIALIFAAARNIVASDRDVRAGAMFKDGLIPYQRFRGWELNGRTAGLIGLGAIGRAVRWRLGGLGMNVLAYDPFVAEATHTLDEVLTGADVISMHVPATKETTGMIGIDQFKLMKDGVIFVNSARADLHDAEALVANLKSGKVAAAALDHFRGEYLAPDDPLCALPNVVLTPHIGGATIDTENNHSLLIAEGIAALLAGQTPEHIANPEVLP